MARIDGRSLAQRLAVLVLLLIAVTSVARVLSPDRSPAPARPTLSLVRYHDAALGFAVDYPDGWQVTGPAAYVDLTMREWYVTEFLSDLYAYGEQVFGRYTARVAVSGSMGRTLTETVAYNLSPVIPEIRDQIESRCCLEVGGEPAMELTGFPWTRWGCRQVVALHDGREYALTFSPTISLEGTTPSDVSARAAFEAFLRTFTFVPPAGPLPALSTATPTPTPAPTPTAAEAAVLAPVRPAVCLGLRLPR